MIARATGGPPGHSVISPIAAPVHFLADAMSGQSSEVGVVVLVAADTAGVVRIPRTDDRALDMAEVPVRANPVEVVLVVAGVHVVALMVVVRLPHYRSLEWIPTIGSLPAPRVNRSTDS